MSLTDRRDLRRIANAVGAIVLIALVVPFVVYGAPQAVGADESFVVLSGSMEPVMSPGDVVIVRDAPAGTVGVGDVITFRTDSPTPTTHRVVEVVSQDGANAYVTKGDANEDPDSGVVTHDRVIGTVMLTIPLLGYAIRFVNTPIGFAAVVVVPLLLFVTGELRSLVGSISSADAPGSDRGVDVDRPAGADAEAIDDGAVAGDDPAATADPEDADGEPSGSGPSLTLTRSSLQIIALIFAVYLPYSAYVAYQMREAWAITMAIATAIGLLFVVGVHAGSRGSDDAAADDASTAGDGDSPDDDPDGGDVPDSDARDGDDGQADGPAERRDRTPDRESDGPSLGPDRAVVDGGVDAGAAEAGGVDRGADAAQSAAPDADDGTHPELLGWQRHLDGADATGGESTGGDESRSADADGGRDA